MGVPSVLLNPSKGRAATSQDQNVPFCSLTLPNVMQATEAHQSASNGVGTLVASTDCTAGFNGAQYAPFSTNDVRAWAATWMYRMDTSTMRYLNDAKTFLNSWLLEAQVISRSL